MDWVSRFLGLPVTTKKPASRSLAHDPEARLARYKRVYHTILALCNRPRNLSNEGPVLEQLHSCLVKLSVLIREESRAPAPHLCLQFSNANHVYALVGRAATVSQHEGIVNSAVAIFAALVDSEEEDFLSSGPFAKSLMRLITRVIDNGTDLDTETAILELLFTIAAKIRLQPNILGVWFQHRPKLRDDGTLKEKQNFVGLTQKEDFPLCYLLIDRVHHEGRIGDFARTGLLYIFEATGRSRELEEWILSSDLPTLMASGLGALYSQLSRELSILHPDATLPAVLAMSDYSTTHTRATAVSAFSEAHRSHIATFLSYLAFWQDILDHCRSDDVRETLLDHFQILFLQQLLYPSLLQSSDTDAGSSVAVLIYITAMLESLDYPDLMHMMLAYLLAISDNDMVSAPPSPKASVKPARSPKALRRRQSLMLLTAPANPDESVEPVLFNLVDLVLNNVDSRNTQSCFASLKLASTIIDRQKKYAFGTLLEVDKKQVDAPQRSVGALNVEVERLMAIAVSYHDLANLGEVYGDLCEDTRFFIEAQMASNVSGRSKKDSEVAGLEISPSAYVLRPNDAFFKSLKQLLRTFWTNSVDVNLALSQAIISIARCTEICLDGWLALDPSTYQFTDDSSSETPEQRPWHVHLDSKDTAALKSISNASVRPNWPSDDHAPLLYIILQNLASELQSLQKVCPNLDSMVSGRKNMLQEMGVSIPPTPNASPPTSALPSPTRAAFLDVPRPSATPGSRTSSRSPSPRPSSRQSANRTPSPAGKLPFRPPPPDTPSTTDLLMQTVKFLPSSKGFNEVTLIQGSDDDAFEVSQKTASLNHVLTNVVVLQEFVLELAAVCQVRAAVLGDAEVKMIV